MVRLTTVTITRPRNSAETQAMLDYLGSLNPSEAA